MDRGGERNGAAAGDRAEADRDRRGVGERHDDVFRLDGPGVGGDLREDRLHALTLRAGAGGHVELAGRVDAHRGALERADAGAFDVAAKAETEIAALLARLLLARAKSLDAADAVERLLQRLRIVAAVVDDRLAVAIGNAETIRHLVGGIMLRRRTSAGSSPSSPAMRSIVRSIANAASGRPAPR